MKHVAVFLTLISIFVLIVVASVFFSWDDTQTFVCCLVAGGAYGFLTARVGYGI